MRGHHTARPVSRFPTRLFAAGCGIVVVIGLALNGYEAWALQVASGVRRDWDLIIDTDITMFYSPSLPTPLSI